MQLDNNSVLTIKIELVKFEATRIIQNLCHD
jgi:hypothetical protein